MSVTLQVSIGEALDKLSILSIKLKKIKEENRLIEVQKEYMLLEDMLTKYKEKYEFHFKILCKINEKIWHDLELFRTLEQLNETDQTKQNELFKNITNLNDDRYRVKNKINILCNSNLKEQKGYKIKHAFVLSHLGLGDCICMNGLVRYLATKYDKVTVACEDYYESNIKLMYKDDKSIELYPVKKDYGISVNFGFDKNKFESITKDADIFMAGYHISNHSPFTDLPFNFYDDMKVDRDVFWHYNHVPNIPTEKDLYLKLIKKYDKPYIFMHSTTSKGVCFTLNEAEKNFKFNHNEILVIDPCKNFYKKGHKYFEIAEELVKHSLYFYKNVIENASKIIMSDSSFFCFSICLKTQAQIINLKARDKSNYNLENLNKINNYVYW